MNMNMMMSLVGVFDDLLIAMVGVQYVFDEVESTLSEGVDGTSGANVSSSISDSLEAELSAIRARYHSSISNSYPCFYGIFLSLFLTCTKVHVVGIFLCS